MRRTAAFWREELGLEKHVEGGWFRETYRSASLIPHEQLPPAFHGPRVFSTAIYFLLEKNEFSAFHRIASDELWHFYDGDPLLIFEIRADGSLVEHCLGNNPEHEESLQVIVGAGNWFASRLIEGGEFALAGCTVAPGFDFADFELAKRHALIQEYPRHQSLIQSLTR